MVLTYNKQTKVNSQPQLRFDKNWIETKGALQLEIPSQDNWHSKEYKEIILCQDKRPLNFVLLEVGCRTSRKPSQLEKIRHAIYSTWGHNIPLDYGKPHVIRMLASYDDNNLENIVGNRNYGAEIGIWYPTIGPEILQELPQSEIDTIYDMLGGKKGNGLWKKIVDEVNYKLLSHVIYESRRDHSLGMFRGLVAERIAQNTALSMSPDDITWYRNLSMHLWDKKQGKIAAREVDMVGFTYNPEALLNLDLALNELEYAVVTAVNGYKE